MLAFVERGFSVRRTFDGRYRRRGVPLECGCGCGAARSGWRSASGAARRPGRMRPPPPADVIGARGRAAPTRSPLGPQRGAAVTQATAPLPLLHCGGGRGWGAALAKTGRPCLHDDSGGRPFTLSLRLPYSPEADRRSGGSGDDQTPELADDCGTISLLRPGAGSALPLPLAPRLAAAASARPPPRAAAAELPTVRAGQPLDGLRGGLCPISAGTLSGAESAAI
ncbi:Protein of unknown function [Gryllus bimaculatus]|nr:Protein of unknown function [Gryllus bimaculatus]